MNPIVNIKTLRYDSPQVLATVLDDLFGSWGWVYIGRGTARYGLPHSPLANPYSHQPHANALYVPNRNAAIEHYRQWLWHRIQAEDAAIRGALAAIDPDTVLVCWCCPLPCHAEVVARAAGCWHTCKNRSRLSPVARC